MSEISVDIVETDNISMELQQAPNSSQFDQQLNTTDDVEFNSVTTSNGNVDDNLDDKLDKVALSDQSVVSNVDFQGQVKGGVGTVVFTATPTFNMNNGNVQKMQVTANITSLTLSNKINGSSYCIILKIAGSGSYTIPQPDSTFGTKTDNSVDDSVASWYPTTVGSKVIYSIIVDGDGETIYSIETITI